MESKKNKEEKKGAPPSKDAKTRLKKEERYFCGTGRRKRSVSRARIFFHPKKNGLSDKQPHIEINGKPVEKYFALTEMREIAESPLSSVGIGQDAGISVKVAGGGLRGQAEATRLAISRALTSFNPEHKKVLRDLGFLTRDDRIVERKKAGLKKARRAPQWKKR